MRVVNYLDFKVISNPHRILARGSGSVFQWDMWIYVGSPAETGGGGSMRNPGTSASPVTYCHYVQTECILHNVT